MNALELLATLGERGATARAEIGGDGAGDARALELLARYRRGGAALELEEIEHAGAAWLALACDLTNVEPEQRGRAFAQIERNSPQLRRALDLEAAARAPLVKVADNFADGGGVAAVIGSAEVSA